MSRPSSGLVLAVVLGLGLGLLPIGRAQAQTFPAASAYVPFGCDGANMVDALGDTTNAAGPLDLVGTLAFPAGFHAADAQFLYLRMRLAATPVTGTALQANAWGFEFDLDGDRSTYELLVSASGLSSPSQVAIYRHPTTVTLDDPADPAVTPPAFSDAFATLGRVSVADSTLSGAPDAFIDLAVSWSDLAAVGLKRDMPVYVWAGSSTVANALDLDLACFGGGGAHLSGIGVVRTTPDPTAGGGNGGGGGSGSGPRTLEGGLGCSLAPEASAPCAAWLALVVPALLVRRRRRAA